MRITKNMVVLNTDIQTEERFEFDPEEIALKVCEEVLKQESFPEDAEISLVVTDAEEVHRLNLEFRGIDRTTDVLSFPGLDFEEPAAFEDSIDEGCINPDNDCVMLGDIAGIRLSYSAQHAPPVRVRPYDSGGSGSYGGETGDGSSGTGDHEAAAIEGEVPHGKEKEHIRQETDGRSADL